MRIGEIAEKTGISISNIRFYEKKGLIEPDREKDSKYRNYTEEDLERIKLIILYRKMDFSVEQIEKIITGEITEKEALEVQLLDLREKQKEIQGAIDLCEKMSGNGADASSDIDFYLNYVKEEEASGKQFAKVDELIEDISTFTRFDEFGTMGMTSGLFIRFPWMQKLLRVLWGLFFFLIPIFGIVTWFVEDKTETTSLIFFAVWLIALFILFFNYRRRK